MPRTKKSVKQMVQDYQENIILPPVEFRDLKPLRPPRRKDFQTYQFLPQPEKRTVITQTNKSLKEYTTSFEISLKNEKDPY